MRLGTLFLLTLASCQPDIHTAARDSMSRAAAYLWQQQGADGGWHSETYGILGSGQSLTPLILLTLLELPEDVAQPPDGAVQRAVQFLCEHVNEQGALGLGDELVPDYPNYATALAVRALERVGAAKEVVQRMRAYLRGQQFTESLGWQPDSRPYGGWGMGGEPRRAPNHGHLDLSMSRSVMEAFSHLDSDAPLVKRANLFLNRCQNLDGGFLFSPAIEGIHKAREGTTLLSYGSTTADGILALLALGADPQDQRVQDAASWLVEHHRIDRVPGFPVDQRGTWDVGLRFYYLAASSRALALLDLELPDLDWREATITHLVRDQEGDGSWQNHNRLVKEDDPLIATSLALQALYATNDGAKSPG